LASIGFRDSFVLRDRGHIKSQLRRVAGSLLHSADKWATNALRRQNRKRRSNEKVRAPAANALAPTATVVVAKGRCLVTPPLDGVLESITTARLLGAARVAGWDTGYERLTAQDLADADGVWLVSSVRLLAPVVSLHGVPRSDAGLTGVFLGLLDFA